MLIPLIACAGSNDKLAFKPLKNGDVIDIGVTQPTAYIFTNEQDWNNFWQKQQNAGPTPSADFSRETFIAVIDTMQPTGGYTININQITQNNGQLEIQGVRTKPGASCMTTMVMTQPYTIVRTGKLDTKGAPLLEVTTQEQNCQ